MVPRHRRPQWHRGQQHFHDEQQLQDQGSAADPAADGIQHRYLGLRKQTESPR